jgi:hypothetical protein
MDISFQSCKALLETPHIFKSGEIREDETGETRSTYGRGKRIYNFRADACERGEEGRIILRWNIGKMCVKVWSRFVLIVTGISGELL